MSSDARGISVAHRACPVGAEQSVTGRVAAGRAGNFTDITTIRALRLR
ncbi:MAG: hypothetical protein ACRDTE_18565 [Pseudonocardiaceae bacterium]